MNMQHLEHSCFVVACLRKKRTGLPVNIFVDDCGQLKESGHIDMVMVQNNIKDLPMMSGMIPMKQMKTLKTILSQSDIDVLTKFVDLNKDLLNRLGKDIDIGDFIQEMVTV